MTGSARFRRLIKNGDYPAAVEVARQAGAKTLVLFHHDPGHDDDAVDVIFEDTKQLAVADGIDVVAAIEGLKLRLPAS